MHQGLNRAEFFSHRAITHNKYITEDFSNRSRIADFSIPVVFLSGADFTDKSLEQRSAVLTWIYSSAVRRIYCMAQAGARLALFHE